MNTIPTMEQLGLKKYIARCLDNNVIWYKTSAKNLDQAKRKAFAMAQKQYPKDYQYLNYVVEEDRR